MTTRTQNFGPPVELLDSAPARGTLTNTTTKTAIRTLTIPHHLLQLGAVINVEFIGSVVDDNSSDTLALSLELKQATPSAIVIATSAALNATTNDAIRGEATAVIKSATTLNSIGHSGQGATAIAAQLPVRVRGGTINLTEDMECTIYGTWSVAHEENIVEIDMIKVTVTPPQE